MKKEKKKMAVLQVLCQQIEPIDLSTLLKKLGDAYKERTVRRWLSEMIQEGLVDKKGVKRSTKYQAAQRILETIPQKGSCFSLESQNAIEYVRKPLYERKPASYDNQWFDAYQPNATFYLSKDVRESLYKAGNRATNKDPAGTYARKIYNRLLIDLSYNSSRLEGNTYSLLETERLILSGMGTEGKLDEEKVMILNHKEAIRYLVENAQRLHINRETIYTVHYLLADGLIDSRYAGKERDHWVRISESTYIPSANPQQLRLQIEKIAEKAHKIEDPFEQSIFLLVHISYLQAFSDVNKRTARLCSNIPLIYENLVPLSFNDVEREDYVSAMIAVYELQNVRPIMDLFIFSYQRSCIVYDMTIKELGFDEIRVSYRRERREIIREIITQCLIGPSMVTYINSRAEKEIPKDKRDAFIEDILEDLKHIDQSRIVGLGITPAQLISWKKEYDKSS